MNLFWPFGSRKSIEPFASLPLTEERAAAHGSLFDRDSQNVLSRGKAASSSAAYACVELISSLIAGLPIRIEKGDNGRDLTRQEERHIESVRRLLCYSPDGIDEARVFIETILADLLLDGNIFCEVIRNGAGVPIQLYHIGPHLVTHIRYDGAPPNRGLIYHLHNYRQHIVSDYNMVHIPMIRWRRRYGDFDDVTDWRRGLAPLQAAGAAVRIGLELDDYTEAFFRQGLTNDFYLSFENKLNDQQRENLLEYLSEAGSGRKSYRKPLVLQGGGKINPLTATHKESRLIDARNFQVEDVARVFGIPLFMVNISDKQSTWGTGLEEMARGFIRFHLRSYMQRLERHFEFKLLPPECGWRIRFDDAKLARGDSKAIGEFLQRALGGPGTQGAMTINEARTLHLDLPPLEGKEYDRVLISGKPENQPDPDIKEKKNDNRKKAKISR